MLGRSRAASLFGLTIVSSDPELPRDSEDGITRGLRDFPIILSVARLTGDSWAAEEEKEGSDRCTRRNSSPESELIPCSEG